MLEEVTNICAYSTVMAFEYEVVAFLKNITSRFRLIFLTIATIRATEVIQIRILLLEVTQARRN
jgi:hypothetical protein